MQEQYKLNQMLDDLWSKILHPDLFDQLRFQVTKANDEYREQVKKELLSKEYLELEPLIKDFMTSKGSHDQLRKMYLDRIVKKLNEYL